MKDKKINIMLIGSTGSGKSSTVNALFNTDVAKVGMGVAPETMEIMSYESDGLVIWDTPGLGDSIKSDEEYKCLLSRKLREVRYNYELLIDIILVVIDASSKDLRNLYELLNSVVIPCLGDEISDRVLIGLNQSDMAMKGKHWNLEKNEPDDILQKYLTQKEESVRQRIYNNTGLIFPTVYYSAGYKMKEAQQNKPYNISVLMNQISQLIARQNNDKLDGSIEESRNASFLNPMGTIWGNVSCLSLSSEKKYWEYQAEI